MSTPVIPPPVTHPRKPLLGLRRKPGRLALAVFRMPLRAYHHDAGWLLGHTFVEFVHTGRKTGQPYETVAMVLRYDPRTPRGQHLRRFGPRHRLGSQPPRRTGGPAAARARVLYPAARFLSDDEAFDVVVQFRREHPRRLRLITTIFGWGTSVTTLRSAASFISTRSSRSARRRRPGPDQSGIVFQQAHTCTSPIVSPPMSLAPPGAVLVPAARPIKR